MIGQFFKRGNLLGAERVQMNVTYQFKKISVFLAKNRFVTVLKQMSMSTVTQIEADRITGQKTPHYGRDGDLSGFQQEMEMVGDQSPSVTPGCGLRQQYRQTTDKVGSVVVVFEDRSALYSSANNVVERSRRINAGLSWHMVSLPQKST